MTQIKKALNPIKIESIDELISVLNSLKLTKQKIAI
jgi:hypothetical protein